MPNVQRGCHRVDSNIYANALLSEQPVEILASTAILSMVSTTNCFVVCSPSNVLDEASLFKYAQHALLHPGSYPARLLFPFQLSSYWVCIFGRPFSVRSFATCQSMLSAYILLANVLPWSRHTSQQ